MGGRIVFSGNLFPSRHVKAEVAMSRLLNTRPEGETVKAAEGKYDNYLDRVAKYMPAEIVAAYIFLALPGQFRISRRSEPVPAVRASDRRDEMRE
jgi:hypothetical protein